jgi:hypothetical protein
MEKYIFLVLAFERTFTAKKNKMAALNQREREREMYIYKTEEEKKRRFSRSA